jgi:hypothetical protein
MQFTALQVARCGVQEELQELKRRRREEREVESREAKRAAQQQEGKKVGDAGYRYHARVPRAIRPDYIQPPQMSESVWALLLGG